MQVVLSSHDVFFFLPTRRMLMSIMVTRTHASRIKVCIGKTFLCSGEWSPYRPRAHVLLTHFTEATQEMVICSTECLLRPKWRYQAEEFGRGRTGVRGGRCGDGETREHLCRG